MEVCLPAEPCTPIAAAALQTVQPLPPLVFWLLLTYADHARPSAEDPCKDDPCCYLLSLGRLGIAQRPTNKEQRCKGFPSRPSVYSCLCLAVLPRRHSPS